MSVVDFLATRAIAARFSGALREEELERFDFQTSSFKRLQRSRTATERKGSGKNSYVSRRYIVIQPVEQFLISNGFSVHWRHRLEHPARFSV
jgi:hypothetical protein